MGDVTLDAVRWFARYGDEIPTLRLKRRDLATASIRLDIVWSLS